MRTSGWVSEPSVHVSLWPEPPADAWDQEREARWQRFLVLRDLVMKALEEQRSRGVIGSPLDARVILRIGDATRHADYEAHRATLAEICVVSELAIQRDGAARSRLHPELPGVVGLAIEPAPGAKCRRCWKHLSDVGSHADHPTLCARCAGVVSAQGVSSR